MFDFLQQAATESWQMLLEMSPYLLLGFLVAGALSVCVTPSWVSRHLGGKGLGAVFKAALLGVPLPLCSCGVIPVAAGLRRHGASKGATTSFLLSTPQTGVDSIAVTYALLGPVFALFRPVAAFVTGIVGGGLVAALDPDCAPAPEGGAPAACNDGCETETERQGSRILAALRYGFLTLPGDLAKPLLAGVVLAGLLSAAVPDNWLSDKLGCGLPAMLAMMAFGIPFYICSTGSVPFALALLAKGVCPGAVLVFLITGPATNAATIAVLWKVLGRRSAAIYLATLAACALASGYLLHGIVGASGPDALKMLHTHHAASETLSALQYLAALALLAVLSFSLALRQRHPKDDAKSSNAGAAGETTVRLRVSGMTCSHCAATVTRELRACPGVTDARVDLASGRAEARGRHLDAAALAAAVTALGYEAKAEE